MIKSTNGMKLLADDSVDVTYNVGKLPVYVDSDCLSNYPELRTAPHWNTDLEIIYVKEGSMNVHINGTLRPVKENDVCIINAGCVHFFETIDGQDCLFYCAIVDESLFSASNVIVQKYVNPVFHAFHPDMDVIPAGSEYSESVLKNSREIYKYIVEKPDAYELWIAAKFHELLALLSVALKETFFLDISVASPSDVSMRKMLSYLYNHYDSHMSIQALCQEGAVSRNKCFSIFRKYTGDTPANFLLKYRLNKSREMLSHTDLSIAQISENCGFTHQSHFTNHFVRSYKMTPSQYRKEHRL